MLRSFSPAAMARNDIEPAARNVTIIGAISDARCAAARATAALPAARACRVSLAPLRRPPSFTPRLFAAASAALVRSEIAFASCSATAANRHFDGDGAAIYQQACKLGCEGIVSKRLGSPYRSGRSVHWLKVKNPKAPAVTREAEEDCSITSMLTQGLAEFASRQTR
jgi:hypothetical protein